MNHNKPEHVENAIWQQHLAWQAVVKQEAETNAAKRQQGPKNNGRYIR